MKFFTTVSCLALLSACMAAQGEPGHYLGGDDMTTNYVALPDGSQERFVSARDAFDDTGLNQVNVGVAVRSFPVYGNKTDVSNPYVSFGPSTGGWLAGAAVQGASGFISEGLLGVLAKPGNTNVQQFAGGNTNTNTNSSSATGGSAVSNSKSGAFSESFSSNTNKIGVTNTNVNQQSQEQNQHQHQGQHQHQIFAPSDDLPVIR